MIKKEDLKDSDWIALNSDGEIVACHRNPKIVKAQAISQGTTSPFIIQAHLLRKRENKQ